MALTSSAVSAGDKAKATQYNNLRTDVTSHNHDGSDTARIPAVDTGWAELYAAGSKLAWTYASADDPTFTFTISGDHTGSLSAGMRIKLTQTTVKYFIITKEPVYSDPNTTVTIYGGTDYDLVNAAITSPYFSCMKAPQGFPLDPDKWSVELLDTTNRAQTNPTASTWYNTGSLSITIPIGVWDTTFICAGLCDSDGDEISHKITLSTANNSESDMKWSGQFYVGGTGVTIAGAHVLHRRNLITNASAKDVYYVNQMTDKTIGAGKTMYLFNSSSTLVVRATLAYL